MNELRIVVAITGSERDGAGRAQEVVSFRDDRSLPCQSLSFVTEAINRFNELMSDISKQTEGGGKQ